MFRCASNIYVERSRRDRCRVQIQLKSTKTWVGWWLERIFQVTVVVRVKIPQFYLLRSSFEISDKMNNFTLLVLRYVESLETVLIRLTLSDENNKTKKIVKKKNTKQIVQYTVFIYGTCSKS